MDVSKSRRWFLVVAGLLALALGTEIALGTPGSASLARADGAPVLVSPSGNDSSCSRGGVACRSWQRAFDVAQSGDVIGVEGGSYPEQRLTGDKAVTFRVVQGQTATFTARLTAMRLSNVRFDGPIVFTTDDPYTDIWVECSSNIAFNDVSGKTFWVYNGSNGVTFHGGAWGNYQIPHYGDSALSGYNGSGSSDCGDGLVRNVTIDGVRFHDVNYWSAANWGGAHPDCFEAYGGVVGVTVRNSVFERCGNTFMLLLPSFGPIQNLVVENNVMRGLFDSFQGVQIGENPGSQYRCDVTFRYNTYDVSVGRANAPPRLFCSSQQVYGNIFTTGPGSGAGSQCLSGWSYNVFESGACGEHATVVKNAFFVERGSDYHLRPGSPAIGRGDPKRFPARDVDGTKRPAGAIPDAGFDEAQPLVSDATVALMKRVSTELETSAAATLVAGTRACGSDGEARAAVERLRAQLLLGNSRPPGDLCRLLVSTVAGWTFVPSTGLGAIARQRPDRVFRQVAVPPPVRVPALRGTTVQSRALAAAFNSESENVAALSGLLEAYAKSIARVQSAGNALDAASQDRQLRAAHSYAKAAAVALAREARLRRTAARALGRAGLPRVAFTAAEARSATKTLSPSMRRSLASIGLSRRQINSLARRLKAITPSELAGVTLTDSLVDRRTLAASKDAASALRRLAAS
jgi:hypothetical protein